MYFYATKYELQYFKLFSTTVDRVTVKWTRETSPQLATWQIWAVFQILGLSEPYLPNVKDKLSSPAAIKITDHY